MKDIIKHVIVFQLLSCNHFPGENFGLIDGFTLNCLVYSTKTTVYLDQLLGAAHPKSWLKSSFSAKKMRKNEKNEKKQEICSKILSTCCVFSPALGCCSFHTLYI